jgi:hypothetical protein
MASLQYGDPMGFGPGTPGAAENRAEQERRLLAKLQPGPIRSTLMFAGLYQLTHEMLKQAILERVRGFHTPGFDLRRDDYERHVLTLGRVPGQRKPNEFLGCALWLVENGAITREQADRLDEIYAHRHELAHELVGFIVDVDREPDVALFTDALNMLYAIHRFWTRVEAAIGTFDEYGPDLDLDEVKPASLIVLSLCIDAYVEGVD